MCGVTEMKVSDAMQPGGDHAKRRLIVGISGASGIVYGVRILEALQSSDIETHLVVSNSAALTLKYELDLPLGDLKALADVVYSNKDIGAAIASGSFVTEGMIIAPCSVKTMSGIATGYTDNLLSRSADVVLKERRRLVMLLRETPLHLGHLRTACSITEMGGIVMPPVPAFYSKPQSLDEMVDHTVGRALDLLGIDVGLVRRWKEADISAHCAETSLT
ncbi:UbiX family flavin prenyltransferase [Mesorhizobium sp. Z1-4]|uniref:UbiX family flavin prenyltransferase n=1 Tax=Mesorhizobium sp. Z1-4 TaxID=2448478 RepID=UPI00247B00CD|nr:UbiX family flavin prenyltransferase [Mesorhizobium sp. Z1-4]